MNEPRNIDLTKLQFNKRDFTDEISFVLKPSSIHGIGVFATHYIPQNTQLYLFPDDFDSQFIPYEKFDDNHPLKTFCEQYGVETDKGIWKPPSFASMPVGCYMNHSDNANAVLVKMGNEYYYFAAKEIKQGEEITTNYMNL